MTVIYRYQSRRRTAANWTSGNEVLYDGEIGYETDTGKFKIGDGVTAWNSIADYFEAGAGGGGGGAWGSITGTLSNQTDLNTALSGKVATSVTVNGQALTGNVTLTTASIADSSNARYVTDAQLTVLGNTSGTNTGDQTNITGNAATVTTNANLTGHVTSVGNAAVLGSFTVAQLNTALSDGDIATGGGTATGTNTGDQTSIVGITGTLAEFNAALTGADFATGGGTVTGTSSGTNTGDQDLSSYATTSAVASGYQPLDTQLTSLAGLSYTGNTLKVVRVNAGESGFELATVTSGSGDVVGPASSTDNAVARFDLTTGKLLQNTTNVTIADTGAVTVTPDANATALTVASHTHTASAPAVDISQTWNNAAVTFVGKTNAFTSTASAASSLCEQWTVGGTVMASISKAGQFYTPAGSAAAPSIAIGFADCGFYNIGAGHDIGAVASGRVVLRMFGTTSTNGGINLGGTGRLLWSTSADSAPTTTTDVGLARNAAGVLEVNNNTAATYRDLKLRNLLAGGGNGSYVQTPSMTVANLAAASTAGSGARAFVTDATATTFLSTVAGGGSNKVPVVSDGTNWLIG